MASEPIVQRKSVALCRILCVEKMRAKGLSPNTGNNDRRLAGQKGRTTLDGVGQTRRLESPSCCAANHLHPHFITCPFVIPTFFLSTHIQFTTTQDVRLFVQPTPSPLLHRHYLLANVATMGWWKADPIPDTPSPASTTQNAYPSSSPSQPPHPIPSSTTESSSACPVDPKTRSLWLQQAQAAKPQSSSQQQGASTPLRSLPASHPTIPSAKLSPPPPPEPTPTPTSYGSSQECSSDRISQSPSSDDSTTPTIKPPRPLSQERTVSSIPRAMPAPTTSSSSSSNPNIPANSESETGTSSTGNWIYPSEQQFFQAVMRKQTASNPSDLLSSISHIIPIHNAVNERAWALIKTWEGDSSASCGGPKLRSFQGLGSGAKSPKARVKSLLGYTAPFDRHDWTVERCDGSTVEYVIDFYQGKSDPNVQQKGGLNFYLDVRPKLNTLEGWKMRAERSLGWR
ncbi:cytochrome c heme-lyase [Exophiala dermatitidis NIH/UT8656]|uniref:Holocytochrome c-type synthase n=2 Tax=Exophiala dermatitidis TaxID=5970 RepID=H6BTU9_EXODN|nr:cytochrome c heme-lyase [Exophiala dermatitidis NIH/UT8656]EHY55526.1 cytochrome c heme-lyase [Exophiala dermatitidis NIH/UT8656]